MMLISVPNQYSTLVLLRLALLVFLSLIVDVGVLVLLVLGNQVVQVGLGLGEFHLVHTLACVPMQESLASEHG